LRSNRDFYRRQASSGAYGCRRNSTVGLQIGEEVVVEFT
jgi:hypothetical protein